MEEDSVESVLGSFEKDLSINKYKLDDECISHASRYAYYSQAAADSKKEVASLNSLLDLTLAERSVAIRKSHVEKGEKFTESVISSELEMDKQVQKVKKALLEAKYVSDKLNAAVAAMDSRRSQLDNLVKLYVSGYFSNVNTGVSRKDVTEQVGEDVRRKLNNKGRKATERSDSKE